MRSTPAEILELSQLTTEPYARGLRPRNITPIAGGSDTVTQVLGTEQVERSIFMKVSKGQIMLAVLNQHARLLNYAKNNTNTIDKSLKPLGGRGKPILFSPSKRQPLLVSSSQRQTTPVFPCHKQPLPILPSQRQLLSISSSQSHLHLSSPPRGSPCLSLLSGVPSSCLHVLEATVPCLPFPEATTPCFALQTATLDRFPVTKISPPPRLHLTEVSSTRVYLIEANPTCLRVPEAILTCCPYLREGTPPYSPPREATPTCFSLPEATASCLPLPEAAPPCHPFRGMRRSG